jgi:hypothetical protein
MKTYWGVEVSGQPHPPAALPPRERNPGTRIDGPQSRSLRGGEEKNSQPLPGLEPSIIQPVAHRYTSELSWLLIEEMIRPCKWGGGCNFLHLTATSSHLGLNILNTPFSDALNTYTFFPSQPY